MQTGSKAAKNTPALKVSAVDIDPSGIANFGNSGFLHDLAKNKIDLNPHKCNRNDAICQLAVKETKCRNPVMMNVIQFRLRPDRLSLSWWFLFSRLEPQSATVQLLETLTTLGQAPH